MSKNFKIPENRKVKNPQAVYQLEDDALEGLKIAARNNQPSMALRYLVHLFEILDDKLSEMDAAPKAAPKAKAAPKSETAKPEAAVATE